MNYQEIKNTYNALDAKTRWIFLLELFGYKRIENHGLKRFFNGKFTWYRPDGKIVPMYLGEELPTYEIMSLTWFQNGVNRKLQDSNFSESIQKALTEYFNNEGDKLEKKYFNNPMFYSVIPFVSQVFILFLAKEMCKEMTI